MKVKIRFWQRWVMNKKYRQILRTCTLLCFIIWGCSVGLEVLEASIICKGVTGVKTNYTDPSYPTIAQYCQRAREIGLNFIIFSDDDICVTKEEWENIVRECESENNKGFRNTRTFIAIPGVTLTPTEEDGNKGITFNHKGWINTEKHQDLPSKLYFFWCDDEGRNQWGQPQGAFITPAPNSPNNYFFYRGLIVYDKDKEYFEEWCQEMGELFSIGCMGINDIKSVEGLVNAKWKIYTLSPHWRKTHRISEELRYIPASFRHSHCYTSSGPEVKEFYLQRKNGDKLSLGDFYHELGHGELITVHFNIVSTKPLTKVILWRNDEPSYCFYPQGLEFKKIIYDRADQRYNYWLTAEDSAGGKLLTSPISYAQSYYSEYSDDCWGACMMSTAAGGIWAQYKNNLTGGIYPPHQAADPSKGKDEQSIFTPGMTLNLYGQEIDRPWQRWQGLKVKNVLVFSSPYAIIFKQNIWHHRHGGLCFKGESLITGYRPKVPGKITAILVDTRLSLLEDYLVGNNPHGPELGVTAFTWAMCGGFANCAYLSPEGKKISVKLSQKEGLYDIDAQSLHRKGYVVFYPNPNGNPALMVLSTDQSESLTFSVKSGKDHYQQIPSWHLEVGYEMPNRTIPAGRTFHWRYLWLAGSREFADSSWLDKVGDVYGILDGEPAYRVKTTHGELLGDIYEVSLMADNYYVTGTITSADLPNPLGIRVRGINKNWTAGMYDKVSNKLKVIGVYNDTAYAVVDVSRQVNFYLGNLLICDNPYIRLTFIRSKDNLIEFQVHNPSLKEVKVTVKSPNGLDILRGVNEKVTLAPGELRVVRALKSR